VVGEDHLVDLGLLGRIGQRDGEGAADHAARRRDPGDDLLLLEAGLEVALDLGRLVVDGLGEVDRVDRADAALEVEAELGLLLEELVGVPGRQAVVGREAGQQVQPAEREDADQDEGAEAEGTIHEVPRSPGRPRPAGARNLDREPRRRKAGRQGLDGDRA
jgi:hypothetical protein